MEKINEQEQIRINKLSKYYDLGIDPFGQKFIRTHFINDIYNIANGKDHDILNKENNIVIIAGRIVSIRQMGKASFFNIQDRTGNLQCYIRFDVVGEKMYTLFKLADIGDIVGIEGIIMLTKTNELTIKVKKYVHLTKSLKVPPEKYHGLTNIDERYRHRYLDFIFNEKIKKIAFIRPKIIREIQKFCDSLGFIEVETSIFTSIPNGADARPFVTYFNALNQDFYLRIATEIPLKKLLVGGFEMVYEIGKNFRNEGIDRFHNPEFTTIELYKAYGDLNDMKKIVENLIRTVNKKINNSDFLICNDKKIDISKPFHDISMTDLIKKEIGIDFTDKTINFDKACELAKKHNIILSSDINSVGQIIILFFETFCENKLIYPTFVHTYPIEISPLTKKCEDDRFVQRFELFINGHEIANAYSELNNPIDQEKRFLKQANNDYNKIDVDFLEAMKFGMPPAGGVGIGIDRLIMLICNEENIREVILFPTLKNKK